MVEEEEKPIIGFRVWRWIPTRECLCSIASSINPWDEGTRAKAVCAGPNMFSSSHFGKTPPGEDCSCGLYAYGDLQRAVHYRNALGTLSDFRAAFVTGMVMAWGILIPHGLRLTSMQVGLAEGFRAEHMKIIALIADLGRERARIADYAQIQQLPLVLPTQVPSVLEGVLATGSATTLYNRLIQRWEKRSK